MFNLNKQPICIGTHHKTGTVWMSNVFKEIAKILKLEFAPLDRSSDLKVIKKNTIYFQNHSLFPQTFFNKKIRGLKIIRDPRDVIISGAHYHCSSSENWLHREQERFGGDTYSQAINKLQTIEEKYRFEMNHVGKNTIEKMLHSDGSTELDHFIKGNFLTVKYEDLIDDTQLVVFKRICDHLDLPLKKVAPAFIKNSLFGQKVNNASHVRSGKKQQWLTRFNKEVGQEFAALHQNSLERLGYEQDSSWTERLG
ncbi:MAG: sulfotransferase domain-containing protein [Kordiimonadaceae bacterium]|nr:sulfotransferase domain-containing protein [Kordiimonadaceae bacterium]